MARLKAGIFMIPAFALCSRPMLPRIHLRLAAAFALPALLTGASLAEVPRVVDWPDLRPRLEVVAEDPFERLTANQIAALRHVVRAHVMERRGLAIPDEGREFIARTKRRLATEGVDVDKLLAERDAVLERVAAAAAAPVQVLDGQSVRISGYALPIAGDEHGVKELFLVPWVGACSHAATPPPNQIIRVEPATPVTIAGAYQAVTIAGKIRVGSDVRSLHFVDGTVVVKSAYAIEGATLSPTAPETTDKRTSSR